MSLFTKTEFEKLVEKNLNYKNLKMDKYKKD
jgi:hypothetical protein